MFSETKYFTPFSLMHIRDMFRKRLLHQKSKKRKQPKFLSRCFAKRMEKQCLDFQSFLEYENLIGSLVIVKGGISEVILEVSLVVLRNQFSILQVAFCGETISFVSVACVFFSSNVVMKCYN